MTPSPRRASACPGIRQRPRGRAPRRGIASVLAMLYLVIFAALALGFYTQTNISAQISGNERRSMNAQIAADSGVKFMRYHLSALNVPHLAAAQRFEEIYMQLAERLDGTANLGSGGLGVVGYDPGAGTISVPDGVNNYVTVNPDGRGFRAVLSLQGEDIVVRIVGRYGATSAPTRGIQVSFKPEERPAPLLGYGMAAHGPVELAGNGIIKGATSPATGSILIAASTAPLTPELTMTGPSTISGDVWFTNPAALTSIAANCSVGGTVDPVLRATHLHKPVAMPEFPVLDTDVYRPFATTNYVAGLMTYNNVRIPAGKGTAVTPVTFATGVTINGVCYIEAPNVVKFAGTSVIRGTIVSSTTYVGGPLTNIIEFAGSAQALDMSTLPDTPQFTPALKALSGSSIITPGFQVKFSGGYASISGTLASAQLSFSGHSGGAITGYVIGTGLQKLSVAGNSEVVIERPATNKWPAGTYFRNWFGPRPESYLEFVP